MSALEQRAAEIVTEMVTLGAIFEIEFTATGRTFVWFARPASQRDAVAKYWDGVEKLPGLRAAMTSVIARHQVGPL